MGAPKQKWTSEEEAALKAGIRKYGLGKWSTILKDPEFNAVLRSRSNVDLKVCMHYRICHSALVKEDQCIRANIQSFVKQKISDKWRNLNCMVNGSGSRHRASAAHKNSQLPQKHDEDAAIHNMVVEKDSGVIDVMPLAAIDDTIQDTSSRKQLSRVDDLILEAITKLKEPRGSSRHTIAEYIEDHHSSPPDFERVLAASLKLLTEKRRLVKVKHQYRIAPRSISLEVGKNPSSLLANGAKRDFSGAQRNDTLLDHNSNNELINNPKEGSILPECPRDSLSTDRSSTLCSFTT
ncbi:hypothetical protein DH2020_012424 [Rehmannia glutinosa]|uniref:MYB transcription factor n=1 Tax=Rehmannia glutinosa TaxID=99300 RepID=A0ABR0X2V0_REHGL